MSKKEKKTKITLRGTAARDFLKGLMAPKNWPAHLQGTVKELQKELQKKKR
jgi:hypothetical protein